MAKVDDDFHRLKHRRDPIGILCGREAHDFLVLWNFVVHHSFQSSRCAILSPWTETVRQLDFSAPKKVIRRPVTRLNCYTVPLMSTLLPFKR